VNENILYIDPSSFSAIIAAIIGGLAGISLYIKTKWQMLKNKNK
jgi:hypothetical protein